MNKYVPEYMAAVLDGDKDKAVDFARKIVENRCRKISAFITLNPHTSKFTAAALKIVANSVYNMLDPKEKGICDEIVKRTKTITFVAPLNAKTNESRKRALGEAVL